jgi:hypothetical protein
LTATFETGKKVIVKLKDVFLALLIVALLASEALLFLANQQKGAAIKQLSQAKHDAQQARADLEQLKATDEATQNALRIENQSLSQRNLLLQNDNKQLRTSNQQLNQQLGTAREAAQQQQQHLQQMQTENQATQTQADTDRDTCIANLRSIQVAKAQWALENGKTAADIPTEQDLIIYLPNSVFPVCPAGGSYTIGAIGNAPTCSITGHVLPQ